MFKGLFTALITPFTKTGEIASQIDFTALEKIINFQIKNGVDGLVICGTTGEGATLSEDEQNELIKQSVKIIDKRVKVIAGTGSNCTIKAIRLTQKAQANGVDGALIVAPYYNKPTQEGLYQHYKAICEAANLPIILYNVPGRTIVNIADETTAKLAVLPQIIGLKDATGDLARLYTLNYELKKANISKNFAILSGEDMTAVSFNCSGGHGVISVTSNILPSICSKVQKLCLEGNFAQAHQLQLGLTNINKIMFLQSNPIVIKYAMYLMGLCSNYVRLPLTKPTDDIITLLQAEMKALELI